MVNWSRVKDDFQQAPDKGKANSVKTKQMVQNWFSFGEPLVNYSKAKHKSQRTSSKFKQDWDRSQQLYYGNVNLTTLARQHPILQMPYSFSPAKRRRQPLILHIKNQNFLFTAIKTITENKTTHIILDIITIHTEHTLCLLALITTKNKPTTAFLMTFITIFVICAMEL